MGKIQWRTTIAGAALRAAHRDGQARCFPTRVVAGPITHRPRSICPATIRDDVTRVVAGPITHRPRSGVLATIDLHRIIHFAG